MKLIINKISGIFLFASLIFFFTACEKETPFLYEVNLDANLDIPPGLNNVVTHIFVLRDLPTFYAQSAEARGLNPTTLKSVRAARGLLRTDFQSVDLDFIDRISVFAVSKKDPNEKREMFYVDNVPFGIGEELKMLSSTTELINIISEELIDVEIRINIRSFSGTTIRTKLIFSYAVL
ncbi:MAG: hypothetical protein IPM42_08165 [Saprospiraceae bacterium]|nr:hypothetical protein [Saprospiraceae bacterium]